MFLDEVTGAWVVALREQVSDLHIVDVHTHLGENDPDGFSCNTGQLTDTLASVGARGVVFPMQEPEGYEAANDMVIEESRQSDGRLVPLARLDPSAEPLAEAERSLAAGAAGIKLHPRAEAFGLDTPALAGVFALADERRLPVLVHAGRGIPALGRHAVALCERHPGLRLILAHAGICDLAWIWKAAGDLPNLLFDTSWWSASDLFVLWSMVPPGQVLFASDAPYGTPGFAASLNLRVALQAGLTPEQIRLAFGGQMERILAGEDLADGGAATRASLELDPLLDRVHTFIVAAIGQLFAREEPDEALTLVKLACEVGSDTQQAGACATVLRLLELREELVAAGGEDGRPANFPPGLQLLVAAAGVLRTPSVPMPPLSAPTESVDERAA
ncbi:MAG: amidohydrolase family protein [Thermoleophilaceae bacterium]